MAEFGLHVSNIKLVTKNEELISLRIIVVKLYQCVDLYIVYNERIKRIKRNIL